MLFFVPSLTFMLICKVRLTINYLNTNLQQYHYVCYSIIFCNPQAAVMCIACLPAGIKKMKRIQVFLCLVNNICTIHMRTIHKDRRYTHKMLHLIKRKYSVFISYLWQCQGLYGY